MDSYVKSDLKWSINFIKIRRVGGVSIHLSFQLPSLQFYTYTYFTTTFHIIKQESIQVHAFIQTQPILIGIMLGKYQINFPLHSGKMLKMKYRLLYVIYCSY